MNRNGEIIPEFEFNNEAFPLEVACLLKEYKADLFAYVVIDPNGTLNSGVLSELPDISTEQKLKLEKMLLETIQKWSNELPKIILP